MKDDDNRQELLRHDSITPYKSVTQSNIEVSCHENFREPLLENPAS